MGNLEFPWHYEEDGEPYLYLRTTEGIFELRRYDTFVFEPEDIAYTGLTHVFHITEELEDRYDGFHLWRDNFEKLGMSFDTFVEELKAHDYQVETFSEPDPLDLRAYERHHGEPFKPNYESVIEEAVHTAMKNFDAGLEYYRVEWGEQYGTE